MEAKDREALSRGMKGLAVRMARRLNALWRRKGSVFADRYWDHILRTPLEVKRALAYVLNNAVRHGIVLPAGPDQYTSGTWFDGWRHMEPPDPDYLWGNAQPPIARVRTWLLRTGWRRHGLLLWGFPNA